jgi:hypothetical protein
MADPALPGDCSRWSLPLGPEGHARLTGDNRKERTIGLTVMLPKWLPPMPLRVVCRRSCKWPAVGFVDTVLGLHSSFLERHGTWIPQFRVTSPRDVEALLVEDIGAGGIAGAVDFSGRPLGLQF